MFNAETTVSLEGINGVIMLVPNELVMAFTKVAELILKYSISSYIVSKQVNYGQDFQWFYIKYGLFLLPIAEVLVFKSVVKVHPKSKHIASILSNIFLLRTVRSSFWGFSSIKSITWTKAVKWIVPNIALYVEIKTFFNEASVLLPAVSLNFLSKMRILVLTSIMLSPV